MLKNLGDVALECGEFNNAELCFTHCLRMYQRIHGESIDHSDIQLALYWAGHGEFVRGSCCRCFTEFMGRVQNKIKL